MYAWEIAKKFPASLSARFFFYRNNVYANDRVHDAIGAVINAHAMAGLMEILILIDLNL